MKINFVKDFKYTDYSNNLFTKILLANALTKKEISKLNEKYKELGLFIKQVEVDEYGKELYPDELLSQNNFLKKKRRLKKHSRMTLQEFYDKYYSENKKSEKNKKKKMMYLEEIIKIMIMMKVLIVMKMIIAMKMN